MRIKILNQDGIERITYKITKLNFAKRKELHCIKILDTKNGFSNVRGLILHEEFNNIERDEKGVWLYPFNMWVSSWNTTYKEINLIDLGNDFYVNFEDGYVYKKEIENKRTILIQCYKINDDVVSLDTTYEENNLFYFCSDLYRDFKNDCFYKKIIKDEKTNLTQFHKVVKYVCF